MTAAVMLASDADARHLLLERRCHASVFLIIHADPFRHDRLGPLLCFFSPSEIDLFCPLSRISQDHQRIVMEFDEAA